VVWNKFHVVEWMLRRWQTVLLRDFRDRKSKKIHHLCS